MMISVPWPRTILHIDMDAFFAAIEQLDNPALRGKPILVGHDGPRGVVCTASYEARPWGCHSAQPMSVAKRRCPTAIVVPVRGARYHDVSQQLFAILDDFSPLVEPLSIDEAFLDATGSERLLGPPESLARQIKERIHRDLGLTASIGVAPNKFLAKLASDMHKPDGLTLIAPDEIDRILCPLPVTRIWGIGPASASVLETMSVRTIADLRAVPLDRLKKRFGEDAQRLIRLAHGQDSRPVTPDREAKSIGHEQTFVADLEEADEVRRVLLDQVEQVARRLRRHALRARGVALKLRYGDFETISRSATLDRPTDVTDELWKAGKAVFDHWVSLDFRPVRLIGFTAERLSAGEEQMDLFTDPKLERQKRVDRAADAITAKFGKSIIRRGGTLRKSND